MVKAGEVGPADVRCQLCGAPPGQRCRWLRRDHLTDQPTPAARERRHPHFARRALAARERDRLAWLARNDRRTQR